MSGYRLYFVDERGAIQAREEFHAQDDDVALAASNLVFRACSDACYSYELWQGGRQVIAYGASRANSPVGLTDEQTIMVQQIALALEEAVQRSHWRIARSKKLIGETERLKERSQTLLAQRAKRQASISTLVQQPAD